MDQHYEITEHSITPLGFVPDNLGVELETSRLHSVHDGMTTFINEDRTYTSVIHGLAGNGFEDENEPLETARLVIDAPTYQDVKSVHADYRSRPRGVVLGLETVAESLEPVE